MDGPHACHTKWSKSDKEKYPMVSLMCRILKEMIQMNSFTRQKQTYRLRGWTYGYQWGRMSGEEIVREFGIDMYTLLYLKWITNKDLLTVDHRELCSMLGGSLDGKGVWGENGSCIRMAESLCCPPETITTLLISCCCCCCSTPN